ncbi:MAG: thioredoxin-disulfide reductase [Candidatus Paceibacterota bacterium]|jgi:thioredoxin reductase (NADPH)
MEIRDLIIIGGGPAGLSAGVYAGRAKLDVEIFTGHLGEGELFLAINVDDFPGFPKGITGLELLGMMQEQAKKFGCKLIEQKIFRVDFSQSPFKVIAEDQKEYYARSIIIATGASNRWLNLEKEKDFIGHGISTCAICDGAFFKGKEVAVVGGGDVALEDALYLTKYAEKIYIIHRREELRAAQRLQEEVSKIPKIEFIFNNEVTKLLGKEQLEAIMIKNNQTQEEKELKIAGLFLAIGFQPVTDIFKDYLETDEKGYLKVHNNVKTSLEGIFAAGDVCDSVYRQAVTAAGTGAIAAIEADEWLREQNFKK